ncbi:MAG: nuclear transport factor 2 family protein [Saprospiraceae bacterium]|nr:nuclear transport factor 2 family protein [Saprospiraceae bacterium]
MKKLTVFLCSFFLLTYLKAQSNKDADAIMHLLDTQIAAWNRGDIDQFMVGYWQSDSLMFIGKSGLNQGYQTTLNNYKRGYPDRATMGTLKFDILKIKPLGKKHCFVVGKWHLTRPEKGDVGGHFSLVFEKIKGKWVIIADHSS